MQMIGSIVSIEAAARTVSGVTDPAVFFIASADDPWLVTEDRSFINYYCMVVRPEFILLYSMASNQEFHCPTATKRATVA